MKRSKFNLTHTHSTTADAGQLIPFLLQPTLPGDRFRIGLKNFIRCQPMVAPLMHEVYFYTQYWYVPYRILWDNWEDFITGGDNLTSSPSFPYVTAPSGGWQPGSLADYFGFPVKQAGIEVSAMPFRAYAEIWNTRYRDEDLQSDVGIVYTDGKDNKTNTDILSPSWKRDYFTLARPWTQRGADILVPISGGVDHNPETSVHEHVFSMQLILRDEDVLSQAASGALINRNEAFNGASVWSSSGSPTNPPIEAKYVEGASGVICDTFTAAYTYSAFPAEVYFVPLMSNYQNRGGNSNITITANDYSFLDSLDYSFLNNYQQGKMRYYVGRVSFTMVISRAYVDGTAGESYMHYVNVPICADAVILQSDRVVEAAGDFVKPTFDNANIRSLTHPNNVCGGTFVQHLPVPTGAETPTSSLIKLTFWQNFSQSGSISVRDLRASAALQRYAERSLKYGNRYEEFIQREFGVKPRDSRIQRPEYLGGGRGILNISEVLQTAEGTDTSVGTMRGHGIASVAQRPIRFKSPEHGIIIGLLSIRPKAVYTQGVEREFLKRSRLDFFTPELANIGMQEVLTQELFATSTNKDSIFGYSDRYQEYRYHKPLVTGEFRDTLNYWNMARIFDNAPNLNDEFVNMEYSSEVFKRPFAVQDQSYHSFLIMLENVIHAWRPIPKRAKDVLK